MIKKFRIKNKLFYCIMIIQVQKQIIFNRFIMHGLDKITDKTNMFNYIVL